MPFNGKKIWKALIMSFNQQKKPLSSEFAPENIAHILRRSWLCKLWKKDFMEWTDEDLREHAAIFADLFNITDDDETSEYHLLSNTVRAALISAFADKNAEYSKQSGSTPSKTEAAKLYEKALKLDPTYTPNLISYARFLMEDDNPEQAQTCLALAYKAKGEAGLTPHMNVMLADIYLALGQDKFAQACIGRALEQKDDPYLRQELLTLQKRTGQNYCSKDYFNVASSLELFLITLEKEPIRFVAHLEKTRSNRQIENELKSLVQYSQRKSDENLSGILEYMIKKNSRYHGHSAYEGEMGRLYFEKLKKAKTADELHQYWSKAHMHLENAIKGPGVNQLAVYQYALLAEYMGQTLHAVDFYEALQKAKGGTLSPQQTLSLARLYNKVSDPENALTHAETAYDLAEKHQDTVTMREATELIEKIGKNATHTVESERESERVCDLIQRGKVDIFEPS
jgi:hypothetical protein